MLTTRPRLSAQFRDAPPPSGLPDLEDRISWPAAALGVLLFCGAVWAGLAGVVVVIVGGP